MFETAPEFADRIRRAKREVAIRGHGRRELLPQALWPRVGAGRRCRVQQGLHHRPGNHRRVPRCRAVCRGAGRSLLRRSRLRRRDGPLPGHRATSRSCRCSSSPASLRRSSRPRPSCSRCSARCTATRRRWTPSPGQCRSHLTGRLLLRRERRPHLRRGHALVGLVAHNGGTLSRERRRRAARVARLISPARPQAPAQALENVLPRQTEPTGHSGRMATAQHRWFSVAASVAMATTLTVLDAAPEAQAQGPAVSARLIVPSKDVRRSSLRPPQCTVTPHPSRVQRSLAVNPRRSHSTFVPCPSARATATTTGHAHTGLWTDLWTVPVRGYAATCHEVLR